MRQTLFAIPDQIAGLPVFGLGLLLAAWVLFSVGLFIWLTRKRGNTSEARGYLPLLGLVAAGIVVVLPRLLVEAEGGLPIRGYGVMMMLGIIGGVGLAIHKAPRLGFDPDNIFSLAFWLFLGGILGARLFHIIQYSEKYDSLGDLVSIQQGGLVVYGSLIGALVVVITFVRRHKLPGLALADLLAPSMVLGLAFGRIGCLLTGCCFGGACDLPWAITFPQESAAKKWSPPYERQFEGGLGYGIQIGSNRNGQAVVRRVVPGSVAEREGIKLGVAIASVNGSKTTNTADALSAMHRAMYPTDPEGQTTRPVELELSVEGREGQIRLPFDLPSRSLPVHPVQIYSTINAALLCCLLLAYFPHRRRDGEVFAILLSIYPITRFLLEIIRTDEYGKFGTGLTISQLASLGILVGVAVLWWYLRRQPKGQLWADRAPTIGS